MYCVPRSRPVKNDLVSEAADPSLSGDGVNWPKDEEAAPFCRISNMHVIQSVACFGTLFF